MFGSNEAKEALILIKQHMRECETDKREIKEALRTQNDESESKHSQNVERFGRLDNKIGTVSDKIQTNYSRLMAVVIAGLIAMVGSLAFQVIQDQKTQPSVVTSPQFPAGPGHR